MTRRLRACVENWPEAHTGGYDPRCCRFPKSCSATVYDPERVREDDLEEVGSASPATPDVPAQLRLNGPMVERLRRCAADTAEDWSGRVTIYPPEARELVALIDHSGVAGEPEATTQKASETPGISPPDARTYEDGLVDGANMVGESITDGLTDEALAKVDLLHSLLHPAQAAAGVHESTRNPGGCDRAWCTSILPELLYAEAVIRADERRAASALPGPQAAVAAAPTPVHPDTTPEPVAAVLAGGVAVTAEMVGGFRAAWLATLRGPSGSFDEAVGAGLAAAAPLIAAQALRSASGDLDELARQHPDGGAFDGFSMSAAKVRERADELERGTDHA